MKRDIKKDKYIVSKDYQLIGARYQLSTIEQKLVLSIISLIQPTDTDFMHYQIPLNNFDNLIENNNGFIEITTFIICNNYSFNNYRCVYAV